jgi:Fur family transcriptional regulator, peroxide stress response regulator
MNQEQKLRLTIQRQTILTVLQSMTSHPTADELYQKVRCILPRISMGTVYRNLDVMARNGLIKKLDIPGRRMRFDGWVDSHHHIRCIRCGRIDDVDSSKIPNRIDCRVEGYKLMGFRVEFIGVCAACNQSENPETEV